MKTFLNVLYRRILYKIPLKFLLLLLCICALLFASANAEDINVYDGYESSTLASGRERNFINTNTESNTVFCLRNFTNGGTQNISYNGQNFAILGDGFWYCFLYMPFNNTFTVLKNSQSFQVKTYYFSTGVSSCDYSGYLTEGECNNLYSGYILESFIDSAYCENNGLCSSSSSGDVSWSALYINNIQHIGGPNIYISIPEEIERDYNYNDYDDMFIDVDGYNVDYDKITGIIDVQNYKPSQEDFNNIIGVLADYMPIIVIFLGLLFIYKMIRKPFKSKL